MSCRESADEISEHVDQFRSLERKSTAYFAYQAIHRFTVPNPFNILSGILAESLGFPSYFPDVEMFLFPIVSGFSDYSCGSGGCLTLQESLPYTSTAWEREGSFLSKILEHWLDFSNDIPGIVSRFFGILWDSLGFFEILVSRRTSVNKDRFRIH